MTGNFIDQSNQIGNVSSICDLVDANWHQLMLDQYGEKLTDCTKLTSVRFQPYWDFENQSILSGRFVIYVGFWCSVPFKPDFDIIPLIQRLPFEHVELEFTTSIPELDNARHFQIRHSIHVRLLENAFLKLQTRLKLNREIQQFTGIKGYYDVSNY